MHRNVGLGTCSIATYPAQASDRTTNGSESEKYSQWQRSGFFAAHYFMKGKQATWYARPRQAKGNTQSGGNTDSSTCQTRKRQTQERAPYPSLLTYTFSGVGTLRSLNRSYTWGRKRSINMSKSKIKTKKREVRWVARPAHPPLRKRRNLGGLGIYAVKEKVLRVLRAILTRIARTRKKKNLGVTRDALWTICPLRHPPCTSPSQIPYSRPKGPPALPTTCSWLSYFAVPALLCSRHNLHK